MLVAASVIALCRVAKPSTFDDGVCVAMLSLMSWFSYSAFSFLQAIRVWRVFCTVRLSFIYTAAVTIEWSMPWFSVPSSICTPPIRPLSAADIIM